MYRKVTVRFCKKATTYILALSLVLMFVACSINTPSSKELVSEPISQGKEYQSELEQAKEPEATADDVAPYIKAYTPLIDAYKNFEKSEFTIFDETIIGDSLLAYGKDWGFTAGALGIDIFNIMLHYSLLDISGDGIPELFIATKGEYVDNTIFGIYTVKGNKAVSVLQKENARTYLTIHRDNTIHAGWGHMGSKEDVYYRFENGTDIYISNAVSIDEFADTIINSNNDAPMTKEEYAQILSKYPDDAIRLNWQPLFTWGIQYGSYKEAFIQILDEQKDVIIGFTGTQGITKNLVEGGAVALNDIYGDAAPELFYVKIVKKVIDDMSAHSQLYVWTFHKGQPQIILIASLDTADKCNNAVFTDESRNIYIYSKKYFLYRPT